MRWSAGIVSMTAIAVGCSHSPSAPSCVYRMQSTAPSIAMPELGRSLEHVEAVALVSEWIAGMQGTCE